MPSELLESTLFGHVKGGLHFGGSHLRRVSLEVANGGNALSGRDRDHGDGHAGQDSARPAGQAVHAFGRHSGNPGGCAHPCGDQHRFAPGRARWTLPRRSFLSAECHHRRFAAVARAARKTFRCWCSISWISTPKRMGFRREGYLPMPCAH